MKLAKSHRAYLLPSDNIVEIVGKQLGPFFIAISLKIIRFVVGILQISVSIPIAIVKVSNEL